MSSTAASSTISREARDSRRVSFALVGVATVVAAVLANTIFYFAGSLFVSYDAQFKPLANVSGAIIFTIVPAFVAVLLFAVLRRFARNPVRVFTIISAVVLVVSIIPDLTYIPTVPGYSPARTAILIAMHIVAAAVIVWTLSAYGSPEAS